MSKSKSKQDMFVSEEDLKNKIIVPFLEELGFNSSEVSYEKSLSLRLGKGVFRVRTDEQINSASGKYDILLKRQGINLAIVEVKADGVDITTDDVDQAVSYARLLDQIAPVCVITNGRTYKVVDSITKDSPNFDAIKAGNYKPSLSLDLYYEALKNFVGYSQANLLAFSDFQVNASMQTLRGSPQDREKRYIKDLYVPSNSLLSAFQQFVQSGYACFVTVGDSGSGKTCWICNCVEKYQEAGYPVFFYRAVNCDGNILSTIAEDINLALSPTLDDSQVLKNLLTVFEKQDKPILIFIDGLDEIGHVQARALIDSMLKKIEGRKIKIIATSKPFTWEKLLRHDGIPSLLALKTFKINNEWVFLTRLEDHQFYEVIKRYRSFYRFSGKIEDKVLKDGKSNPYLLRVMFEVASKKGLQNLTYTTLDFFDYYFEEIIERFDSQESVKALLFGIAGIMFCRSQQKIDIDVVRSELKIPINEEIDMRLFDLNIFEKHEEDRTTFISFYFQRFRDYVIAFRVEKWQKRSFQELCALLPSADLDCDVRRDARNLYYMLCSEEHKRALDGKVHANAHAFVSLYENVIKESFPSLKKRFSPFTNLGIGFVGYFLPRGGIINFGFRCIENGEPKVLLFPIEASVFGFTGDNLAHIHGVDFLKYRSSLWDFKDIELEKEVLRNEITPQLLHLIGQGLLIEDSCTLLLEEKATAIFFQYYQNNKNERLSDRFPLKISAVRKEVLYRRAYMVLKDRLIADKIATAKIAVARNGSFISYRSNLNAEEEAEVRTQSLKIAEDGKLLKDETRRHGIDEIESEILSALNALENAGRDSLLPLCPDSWYETFDFVSTRMTSDVGAFLQKLLLLTLKEYSLLIQTNFFAFREVTLLGKMPLKCFWVFAGGMHFSHLYIGFGKKGEDNSVVVCMQSDVEIHGQKILYKGSMAECPICISGFSRLYADNLRLSCKVDERLVLLRALVYRLVDFDFPEIVKVITKKHGAGKE